MNLPYSPSHSLQWLERFFTKHYFKKPYDRFMWWRSYTPKSKPLPPRSAFRDRILNGDLDLAPYRLEAEIVEHRMNQKWVEYGYKDAGRWNEETSVDRARRKRLLEDYDKEEVKRLDEIKKGFVQTLKMSKDDYDKEVVRSSAANLITFYDKMAEKYGTYWKPLTHKPKGLRLASERC